MILPATIAKGLRPFQREGVKRIERRGGRVLLADEQGLGKTIQVCRWLRWRKRMALPALIVCPSGLKYNWEAEFKRWFPKATVSIWEGWDSDTSTDISIINYDLLARYAQWSGGKRKRIIDVIGALNEFKYRTIVFDEGHYIKTPSRIRTKAALQLAKRADYVLVLTGTPITSKPLEVFSQVKAIDPTLFPKYRLFIKEFCKMKKTRFGLKFEAAKNTAELHERLKPVMIRRLKKDVLRELPPKIRTVIPIALSNQLEYARADCKFREFAKKIHTNERLPPRIIMEGMAQIEKLKQLALKGKIQSVYNWVDDFLESGKKLVLFAWHIEVVDLLYKRYEKTAVRVYGSTSTRDKQSAVLRFQKDKSTRLFVANIQSGGTGHTLTAASDVAFVELAWTPAEHDQGEDRCHRITQRDSVTAWYLLARGTIEERIAAKLDVKRRMIASIVDGAPDVSKNNLIVELLREAGDDYKSGKGGKGINGR